VAPDDLDPIRAVLKRGRSISTRWHECQPLVLKACQDAMVEVVNAGLVGFVDTLDDGRIVFAVLTPNRGRPCLLFGPTVTSHQRAHIAYGTTLGIPGPHKDYELGLGIQVQLEIPIEELDRTSVLKAIEEFLTAEVIA